MFKECKLGDYCEITSSKRIFASEYVESGIPFYRSREVIERESNSDISDPLFISEKRYNEIKSKFGAPQEGELLLTSVGTLGIPYIVKKADKFYFKDGNLTWMKEFSDELDVYYLYYWFKSDFGRSSLIARSIGSSQGAITIDILKRFKILCPSVPVQKRIVDILSKYDELIELNNQRIKLLEQVAEELYKEWFVRFRFPKHQTTEFENGIPKGWELKFLFEISKVNYGFAFSSDLFCENESLNPVVRIRDIPNNKTNTYTSETCDEKYLICENRILVGMDGIFHMCLWTGGKAFLNQRVVMINSDCENFCNYLLYMALYPQVKFWEVVIAGTTVAHLGDKHLKKMKILVPDEAFLKKYNHVFESIMIQKSKLMKQNENLIKQRDYLLPRLMSGKLEV